MHSPLCKTTCLFILIINLAFGLHAQPLPPDTVWMHTYMDGTVLSGCAAPDGGTLVLVSSPAQVIRLDSSGNLLWSRSYQLESPRGVVAAIGDGFFAVGTSADTAQIIRADGDGAILWTRAVRVDSLDITAHAAACSDGGLILTDTKSDLYGHIILARFDSAAVLMWRREYGPPTWGWTSKSVVQTHDGGFLITGTTNQIHPWQAFLMKTDSAGTQEWSEFFGTYSMQPAVGYAAIQTADRGFAFAFGWVASSYWDLTVKRYDSTVTELWQNTYPAEYGGEANAIAEWPSGCLVLAGSVSPFASYHQKFAVIGTNSAGAESWRIQFPDSGMNNEAMAIIAMPDGDLTVLGHRQSMPQSLPQVFAMRIGDASDNAATLGPQPRVPTDLPLTAYPNPFNPSTEISFALSHTQPISLKVFDVLGRDVMTLLDGTLTAGDHRATFDRAALPSGVYFYQLKGEGFTQTKKMLLLK